MAEQILTRGYSDNFEKEYVCKDGRILPVRLTRYLVKENGENVGMWAVVRDITERKKAESDQRRLSAAIEHAAESVVITDANGIIQYVNPAEEIISGYCRDELIGQGANIFKSDKHGEDFYVNMWETIKAGNVWSGRFVNKKRDGTEYHEDATISPVYDDCGKLTNFVAVKHDVTKQLELQNQLLQAQKMEAIGTLAGALAHDFNNLLQIILGNLDVILSDPVLPKTIQKSLSDIDRAATRGADLVKGMLVYSRKTEFKLEPVNLNKLVQQVRSFLDKTIPKTIEMAIFKDRSLSMINGDHTQLEQILINLAINARDAMPSGGKLTIETRNTVLDEEFCNSYLSTKPGRYVLLSVTDSGAGMDQETVKRIFEPFFTTKEPGKGTGLGLSVVYGIVEKHGAKIICNSGPDLGTTFRIYFPAIEQAPQEQCSEKKEPPMGRGETILVVDDEPSFREIISRQLNRANYKVITSSNGTDALKLYEKHREEIRLVMLDLIMPGMDGKRCLEALRNMDPNVRVLVASGKSKQGIAEDLKEAGATDFIKKPFDMPQLLEKIRKILDED